MQIKVSEAESKNVIELIQARATNLYETRQLYCSEAVLVALNYGFGGGLSEKSAIGLASAFPVGIGNSGCLCGAIGGGLIAIGLILGEHLTRDKVREAAGLLHARFKEQYGSTCCRVLTRDVKEKPSVHFRQCSEITKNTARLSAEILMQYKPELIYSTDISYLKKKDNTVLSLIKKTIRRVR